MDAVTARWVGPFQAELPDKTLLVPRETVVTMPAHEAVFSEHWQPVEASEAEEAADFREIAERHNIQVAWNASAETIRERLIENGIEDFVTYQDVELDIAALEEAEEPASEEAAEGDTNPETSEDQGEPTGETSTDEGGGS